MLVNCVLDLTQSWLLAAISAAWRVEPHGKKVS